MIIFRVSGSNGEVCDLLLIYALLQKRNIDISLGITLFLNVCLKNKKKIPIRNRILKYSLFWALL